MIEAASSQLEAVEIGKSRPETVCLGHQSTARLTHRLKLVKPRPNKGSNGNEGMQGMVIAVGVAGGHECSPQGPEGMKTRQERKRQRERERACT